MSKLKPCPTGCREFGNVDVEPSGSVVCNGCGFSAPDIGTWNTRAPSPAVKALVEACKGLVPTLRSGDWGNQDETAREIEEAIAAVEKEIQS